MSSTTGNHAFYQDAIGIPGVIRESPLPATISDTQILVKVHSWAINPADNILQTTALPFIKYPLVLGSDVAGVIEKVGDEALKEGGFKEGDRVIGMAMTIGGAGGFQEHATLSYKMVCKIPSSLPFSSGVVFPLGMTSSAAGLFGKPYLGMPLPTLDESKRTQQAAGKSVFIWGGSSAVGSNAIQLSKGAGFTVFTCCSARNFSYVKSLGADFIFDYGKEGVLDEIVAELDKTECVGIFHAVGTALQSIKLSQASKQKLFVASTNNIEEGDLEGKDVVAKWIIGAEGMQAFGESRLATFGGYVPEALEKGVYKIAPSSEIIDVKGLEGIQVGIDRLREGVSAGKIVVLAE